MFKYIFTILLTIFVANSARATDDFWITSGFLSHHISGSEGLREENPGVGFQYDMNECFSLVGGRYLNSMHEKTDYYGVFSSYRIGVFRAGFTLGQFNGYSDINNGGPFLGVVPTFAAEGKRFGVNLVYIPTMFNMISVVAVQFKVRL